MPADGDTVITPAQVKAGQERKRQQQKHTAADDPRRTYVATNAWPVPECEVCIRPIRTAAEGVYVRVDGHLVPRHRACNVGAIQPARMGGSAT
jgi:hypothetical protein